MNLKDRIFGAVIAELNDRNEMGNSHLFDCGGLGFMEVYWGRSGWERRWFLAEVLPDRAARLLSYDKRPLPTPTALLQASLESQKWMKGGQE